MSAGPWAAGDAASREAIVGGASGAAPPNAAFTIGSGTWSGRAAAATPCAPPSPLSASADQGLPAGRVGPRAGGKAVRRAWRELSQATQEEMLPPAKNGYRNGGQLTRSLDGLDDLWAVADAGSREADAREQVSTRETAAMIACRATP